MSTLISSLWTSAAKRLYRKPTFFLRIVMMCCFIAYTTGCSQKTWKRPVAGTKIAVAAQTKLMVGSPAVRLEIHHINIGNGDASVIRVLHKDGTETKVLIDGGQLTATRALLPYINAVFKNTQFKYIVLSHYHNDHYNGLDAIGAGTIRGDYYIDLGGYNLRGKVPNASLALIQPKDTTCPWTDSIGVFDGNSMDNYITALGTAAQFYGLKRYMPMTTSSDQIGTLIGTIVPLDTFVNGTQSVPIRLRCVALWGYTMGANGAAIDNWNNGASKNDPCIGFVLECGEFRYFFGGDMGGYASGSYIDQETTLSDGFKFLYKGAESFYDPAMPSDGHVCGFKANHHGSDHSNNSTFLGTMKPSVCVTSAGENGAWHLPSIGFLDRLNDAPSITDPNDIPSTATNINAQAFLFTNLYNFGAGRNSLGVADSLFDNRDKTEYGYGRAGYEIALDLTDKEFLKGAIWLTAYQVRFRTYKIEQLSYVVCHQK